MDDRLFISPLSLHELCDASSKLLTLTFLPPLPPPEYFRMAVEFGVVVRVVEVVSVRLMLSERVTFPVGFHARFVVSDVDDVRLVVVVFSWCCSL